MKYAKSKQWSSEEEQEIIRRYPDEDTGTLASELGVSKSQLYYKAGYLGIKKSERFIEAAKEKASNMLMESGRSNRFKSGIVPWNKGLKWTAPGRSALTRFKKANRPPGYRPIGSERVNKGGYLFRKVSDTGRKREDWIPVSHIVWKEAGNGEVPEGCHLCFRDGNNRNFEIGNLELVSCSEVMRRNSVHNLYPEISSLYNLIGAINRHINKRTKEKK